jgi:hypothetical protein
MNRYIDGLINYISSIYFLFKFYKLHRGTKCLTIIDIDNTIANTWPTIKKKDFNYIKITPLINSIRYIKSHLENKNSEFIFLSHRNLRNFDETHLWLKKNFDSKISKDSIFLVNKPNFKLYYYKYLAKRKSKIIIFDDLSRNHENGKILFYDKVIKYIEINGFEFYDYNFIKNLNK